MFLFHKSLEEGGPWLLCPVRLSRDPDPFDLVALPNVGALPLG